MSESNGWGRSRGWAMLLLTLVVGLVGGCNSNPYAEENIQDPFEPVNRGIFGFNLAVDKHMIQPVAGVYRRNVPVTAQHGINNFFNNAAYPHVIANDALQLNLGQTLSDVGRFALNTTVGLGGLFDPASDLGLKQNEENFGVTAGKWRAPEGPYIVLPLLGPHTLSSLPDIPLRLLTNPIVFINPIMFRLAVSGTGAVSKAAETEQGRKMVRESLSPYAFMRNAYYQRQRQLVNDEEVELEPTSPFEPLPLDDLDPPPAPAP